SKLVCFAAPRGLARGALERSPRQASGRGGTIFGHQPRLINDTKVQYQPHDSGLRRIDGWHRNSLFCVVAAPPTTRPTASSPSTTPPTPTARPTTPLPRTPASSATRPAPSSPPTTAPTSASPTASTRTAVANTDVHIVMRDRSTNSS